MRGQSALRVAVLGFTTLCWGPTCLAQTPTQDEILKRLQKLEENQEKLYELLKSKDAHIEELESEVGRLKQELEAAPSAAPAAAQAAPPTSPAPEPSPQFAAAQPTEAPTPEPEHEYFGTYGPGRGFGLVSNEWGQVNFSAYTYVRYLNQDGLNNSYVNGLGNEVRIDHRDDVELNKVMLYFKGWLFDPHFRYLFYTWTNNTTQGLGAQVVVGGNLTYTFHPALTFGAGIAGLPTTRSTQGSFPYFLTVDHRTIADEFFKGSYTMGFFAVGQPLPGVQYNVMLGNNLSQLGVDAGQLDGDFTTVSAALWWMPTTGEFGPRASFGDYEEHENLATLLGAHFTFSPEDRQSQPGTDDIDNSQIRLSNGTVIFTPGALAQGVAVKDVNYYMASADAALKYRGFALEGSYYLRWLGNFNATGPLPDDTFFDHGFEVQVSKMVWPKILQLYTLGSAVFGEFGDPWDVTAGLNWYPFRRREVRLNVEYIYVDGSPVGYFAIPYQVGGTGSIFNANLELYF